MAIDLERADVLRPEILALWKKAGGAEYGPSGVTLIILRRRLEEFLAAVASLDRSHD